MAYESPKTNWKSTDYFNPKDYNRICENIARIYSDYVIPLYSANIDSSGIVMPTTLVKDYTSMLYASEFQEIEDAVYNINAFTCKFRYSKKTWRANAKAPDYKDMNRIEEMIGKLHDALKSQYDNRGRLPFTLGRKKGVGI